MEIVYMYEYELKYSKYYEWEDVTNERELYWTLN